MEIKPCACGNHFMMAGKIAINPIKSVWQVECLNCGAHGPARDTSAEAIDAWNRNEEGGFGAERNRREGQAPPLHKRKHRADEGHPPLREGREDV